MPHPHPPPLGAGTNDAGWLPLAGVGEGGGTPLDDGTAGWRRGERAGGSRFQISAYTS